jgi:pyruvate,water dikinase
MCEIPSNALLAEQFLEHFDGFSIGSNDLTQLTLGLDRDPAWWPTPSTNATRP